MNVAQETGQRRSAADVQHRRHVAIGVEHDAVVGSALDDTGDPEAGICRRDVRLLQELQAQPADLDQRCPIERRVAVLDLQLAGDVARQGIGAGAAQVGLVDTGPPHGEGQNHEGVPQRRRDVQRRREWIAGRAIERRAVREHPPRAPHGQLAELEQGFVDRELQEAPGVRAQGPSPLLDLRFEVAVVLLEVLGLEERPLGPDDSVVPAHRRLTSRPA